jgi:2',3'-cyclic-nucleotide 2'-phosphodiesterase (5'-nucleotidase family)
MISTSKYSLSPIFAAVKRISFIAALLLLIASGCKPKHFQAVAESNGYTYVHDSLGLTDEKVESTIAPYRLRMDSMMNRVVGSSSVEMVKAKEFMNNGTPESPIGNFIADLVLLQTNRTRSVNNEPPVDMCLLNSGGIRSSFPKGPITVGAVYEVMPFDNIVVVQEMSGATVQQMLDFLASKGGFPIAGFTMGIRNGKPVDVRINGVAFNPDADRTYLVVTSDYLQNGGDNMEFFRNSTNTGSYGLLRDMILNHFHYLTGMGVEASATADGRMWYDK